MTHAAHEFAPGEQRMPVELLHALALVHGAAAWANRDLLRLGADKTHSITQAAESVAAGGHDDELCALAWQPDAGPRSQRLVATLVARLASHGAQGPLHTTLTVNADADVAMGQSAVDSFGSAAQVAVALHAKARLLPALGVLRASLAMHALAMADPGANLGRARGADAPAAAQRVRALAVQLAACETQLRQGLLAVQALAFGPAAEGVHPLLHSDFNAGVVQRLAARLDLPLTQAIDTPGLLIGHTALLALHGNLRLLALALTGVRQLGSGVAADGLAHACAQVVGHDAALVFLTACGTAPVPALAPLIVVNTLNSLRLLADAMHAFSQQGLSHPRHSQSDPGADTDLGAAEPLALFVNGLHPPRPHARPLDAWSDSQPRRADL